MNIKKIVSILILAAGVILILYAFHSKGRIDKARGEVSAIGSVFSGNAVGNMFESSSNKKLNAYSGEVRYCFIAGIVLVIIGGGAFLHFRRSRS